MAFPCVNCGTVRQNKKEANRRSRHLPISSRLQVHEKDPMKPLISIAEALEEIFEKEVTTSQLQRYAGCFICKECNRMLRLAVNKKSEVEDCMTSLHERMGVVTSKERRQYYREHYATQKAGKCWGCMFDFSTVTSAKGVRYNMDSILFDKMTVLEGVTTLLEEEADSLHGLFPRNTYLCKTCYQLMKQVVRNQCLFETLYANFMARSTDKSIIACLKRGETPSLFGQVSEKQSGPISEDKNELNSDEEETELVYFEGVSVSNEKILGKGSNSTDEVNDSERTSHISGDKQSGEISGDRLKIVDAILDELENSNKSRETLKVLVGKRKHGIKDDSEQDVAVNYFENDEENLDDKVHNKKAVEKATVIAGKRIRQNNKSKNTYRQTVITKRQRVDNEKEVAMLGDSDQNETTQNKNPVQISLKCDTNCGPNYSKSIEDKISAVKDMVFLGGNADSEHELFEENWNSEGITEVVEQSVTEVDSALNKETGDSVSYIQSVNIYSDLSDHQSETVDQLDDEDSHDMDDINKAAIDTQTDKGERGHTSTATHLDHSYIERDMSADDWVLYYYPGMAGRAEFVRLVFEEAEVPYKECGESWIRIRQLINQGEMPGYPHFAPPLIKKGDFQLSQTPIICRYLGEKFGLYPETEEDKLHAEQINQCCHDYIAEGRLTFHGINPVGPYLSQKEATQPYIDRFLRERLSLWMKYFERVLRHNDNGTGFLYGSKLTYADLALFHVIHATESQFPESYKSADYMPLLKSFKDRIASRPRIAAYLKSDRWIGFSDNSMM